MAVKGKGKQVATDPPRAPVSGFGGKRRKGTGDAGPSSSPATAKRRRGEGVLQFFDDVAGVADEYEEEEEGEEEPESEDDLDDGFLTEERTETANLKRTERSHPLPFLGKVKEEELSGDELEEFVKDRYSNRVKYAGYGGSSQVYDDDFTMDDAKEPTIWRVKCMVGRERQMAFCFMQKFVDLKKFGTKVPIISAFALDHVRGFVFVEAEKACDVTEACKGFCTVYASRIGSVPASEVPSLLSTHAKPFEISPGTWVRLKNGTYKGDLAQVVSADDGRKRVMIKLIPRVDLQAISKKFGGAISLKEAAVPAPRLISSQELEFFRPHIEMRRDRQTGDVFEVLDGLMFKDGFLYKRVSLSSLIYWGIQPTETELLKFSSSPSDRSSTDDLDWVSSIYGPKKRNLPREREMKASSSKEKCSRSKASNLKASTSAENYDDDEFKLHDLVLFGRKDFGVVIAVEKDGFKVLKGGPEGSAVTVRKQDIKKSCVDKMFTAVDHQKKTISINDTVKVLEGPFQDKQGVVKHLYMGILFIHNESESENNGFFCAQCGSCENIKKRKELASSTAENLENNPIPMFSESYEQNEQRDTERPYRSTREQLFSIGQMLRIRKGPLKGYLCRVVRIFRNDVTVKLDSLLKTVTVQAELLSVPTNRGGNSSSAPFGTFGNQEASLFGSETEKTSWDNGLPSFGSDSWQPFSSSSLPVQNADGESAVDPWCKKTTSAAEGDSDPWGKETSSGVEVWNNNTTQKESSCDNAWEKQTECGGSDVGGSSWDRAGVKDSDKSDNWGEAAKSRDENQTSNWNSSEDKKPSGGEQIDPWASKITSTKGAEDNSDGWNTKAKDSSFSTEGEERKTDPWANKICSTKGKEQETDPWASKVTSTAGTDDNNNGWNIKATDAFSREAKWGGAASNSSGAEENADAWNSKGGNGNGGGWNNAGSSGGRLGSWDKPSSSSGDQEPAWSKPKFGDDNAGRGNFGRGNQGGGRGRNFGDGGSSWGGSNRNDGSGRERSDDRWNMRDFDGGRGGRGRFGRGDRNQGNNFGSGDRDGSSWGSGRGNGGRDGGYKNWNGNNDRGGSWSQSSDWNANKGTTEGDQAFSKGKSSWGSDKNDSWDTPKQSCGRSSSGMNTEKPSWGGSEAGSKKEGSWEKAEGGGSQDGGSGSSWDKPGGGWNSDKGGDDQAGKNDGNNTWNQNKPSFGGGSSVLGQWGASPGDATSGRGGSVGGGGSSWDKPGGGWNSNKDDRAGKNDGNKSSLGVGSSVLGQWGASAGDATSGGGGSAAEGWSGSGMNTEKPSWGGSEAGSKKEGSWEKAEGSGSQGGSGGSSWDKADGGWDSNKSGGASNDGW